MVQHTLRRTAAGAVVVELVLVMPMLLLVLAFLFGSEVTLRTSWCSEAAARLAAWSLNRAGVLPASEHLVEMVRLVDARTLSCEATPERLEATTAPFDQALRAFAGSLPGELGARFEASDGAGDGAKARAHLGARWGDIEQRCLLDARTWTAYELGVDDGALRLPGEEMTAGALAGASR